MNGSKKMTNSHIKHQVGSIVDYDPEIHGEIGELTFFESWGNEGDLHYGDNGLYLITPNNEIKVYLGIAY